MFSNIFNSVVEKLSGLNPIKTFIKYALDKFLNQLINNEIRLEDFKNGCLNLTSIGFNVENVNLKHLITSPYIMHSGSIGNLRIQLPSLGQIVAKSIQIQVNEILIELKPNKDFYKNFKERMKQLQQNLAFDFQETLPEQELSQNNPMDFFKETLKKILLNIKIKVQNIVVKIYMNNPSETTNKNPFYLMIRIPTINLHKSNDPKGRKNMDVEEIKLDIQMPQFTMHLMKEGVPFPEFNNQKFKKEDFPFAYPTANHPSTILLFGLNEFKNLNIQTDKSIPRLTISVITNNKAQKRDVKISAVTSKIQVMTDPLQIKILSRFLHQIKEFKNIFGFVKNELNLGHNASQDFNAARRHRVSQGKNEDIFSSICMSILEPQISLKTKKTPSIIDSMIRQSSDLEKSVSFFNTEFKKQLQEKKVLNEVSRQMTAQLRVVNFQKHMEINLQVRSVYIYVLKKVSSKSYYRKWMDWEKGPKINHKMSSSYFMFSLQELSVNVKEDGKLLKVEISKLKLENVKLIQPKHNDRPMMSASDEFLDVQSSMEFYLDGNGFAADQQTINQFALQEGDHYCVEQIVRISQKPSENLFTQKLRIYNFLPKPEQFDEADYIVYKPGFKFLFNNTKTIPLIKIEILEIAVNLNPEIIKEVLDIYFPISSLQRLSESLIPQQFDGIHRSQNIVEKNKISFKKRSLLESQYNFGMEYVAVEEFIQKKQKPLVQISIHEINLGFYESPLEHFSDLNKNQSFNQNQTEKHCFCNLNRRGLYFQSFGIQVQAKDDNFTLSLKRIVTGYIELSNSKIKKIKAFLSISSKLQGKALKVILEKNHKEKIDSIFFFLPDCSLNIDERQTLNCIELIKSQILVAEELLFYYRFLKSTMDTISKEVFNFDKRQRKNVQEYEKSIQLYLQTLHLNVLNTEVYMKHIYVQQFTDHLLFKLSTVVFSVKQDVQLFLNQMKNQELCLRQFIQKSSRYPFTKDSNIILEIHDDSYKPQRFDHKNKKIFFQNLSKTQGSVLFQLSKNSFTEQSSTIQKSKEIIISKEKFKFSKKPSQRQSSESFSSASIIAEQQQLKKIQISVSSPVYISVNNLFRLLEKKNNLTQFVSKVKQLTDEILMETRMFSTPERKNSTDSGIQKVEELKIKIQAGKINIDIRPTFVENKHKKAEDQNSNVFHKCSEKEIIFGSSRSYLEFQWDFFQIGIQKRIQKTSFKGSFNLKYYFLEHEERQITTNPIFIHEKELEMLGFLRLFELKNIKLNAQLNKNKIRMDFESTSLTYQSSISTLCYLSLHWEHFLNHNIKRNFGLTIKEEEEKFQVLDFSNYMKNQIKSKRQSPNDSQIQDLTQGLEIYRKKTQFKKTSEASFKAKQFEQPKSDENCEFFLQKLSIKEIKVKIYSGSDFEFLAVQSMNESREKKRNRINDSQILKYLQVRADLFYLSLKISNMKKMDLESFTKVQNFQINFSNKKQPKTGISNWFKPKTYSQQVVFPILRSLSNIKVLFDSNAQICYLKLNKTPFDLGFTSQILLLVDEFKEANERIKSSGWKKVYGSQQKIAQVKEGKDSQKRSSRLILVYIPEMRLNLRLIYKGISLLTNQSLSAGEFLLHQESNNSEKMIRFVNNWVKSLLLLNIGGLISGTALNFLGDVIIQILNLVQFMLSLIFKGGQPMSDE